MKKLAVVFVVLLVAACGLLFARGAEETKTIKIANSVAEYNEWNHLFEKVMLEKCEEYGYEYQLFDSTQDPETQINQVRSAIAQGFKVLVIQPSNNAALAPVMGDAADAGMIVISLYDISPEYGINDKIYQVLFGQKASGVLQAEEYLKREGENNKVAIIAGLTGADNAQQRTAGFMEVFDKHPGIKVIQTVYCDWDRQKAMAAAEDIITAHPDLDAFIVQDDGMSWGVHEAIVAAGKQDQIKIASQGFYESSIQALKDGYWLFTITYPAGFFARDAMILAHDVLEGKSVARIQTLGMELVTVENADIAAHD